VNDRNPVFFGKLLPSHVERPRDCRANPITSRRRMRSPDGSTNERMRDCRPEQYYSYQMNDLRLAIVAYFCASPKVGGRFCTFVVEQFTMQIPHLINLLHSEMTAWRQDLHAHPELGFEENRASEFAAGKLA
jgi:hypothetical protein